MRAKSRKKWIGVILSSFVLFILLPHTTLASGGEKVLERPGLSIDNKGKVSVKSENGTVESKTTLVNRFLKKYRVVIAGISGLASVSMILFFIIGFMRLGATSSNPEARSQTIRGLILTGIAAAGLGAVALITGIFYNSFI